MHLPRHYVQLYAEKYFRVCDRLPMPAFYVCGDIAVNSGTGRAREYLDAIPYNNVRSTRSRAGSEHNALECRIQRRTRRS